MVKLWEVRRPDTQHAVALIRANRESDAAALARSEFGADVTVRPAKNVRVPAGFRLLDQPADGVWPARLHWRVPFSER